MRYLIQRDNIEKRWFKKLLGKKEILKKIRECPLDKPDNKRIALKAVREGCYKLDHKPAIVIEGQGFSEVIIKLTDEDIKQLTKNLNKKS